MTEFFTPPAIVIQDEASVARHSLDKLIATLNKSNIDVAEILWTIKKNNYYAPHLTFVDFVKTTSLKPQKARYLCKIAEVMEKVGIPRESYESLGTSKLRELTSLDPEGVFVNPVTSAVTPNSEFIKAFVKQGDELSLETVQHQVKVLKGLVGDNELVTVHWSFTKSALENVIEPAVELTRKNVGSVGVDDEGIAKDITHAAAVEAWAVEYLNDPFNTKED